MKWRYWMGCWALFLLPALALAEEAAGMAPQQVTAWRGVLKSLPDFLVFLHSDFSAPVLVAICNVLVALLKTKWFQNKVLRFWSRHDDVELTDAGQTVLALMVGVLVAWLLSPASTELRTIGKGLGIGFAAIGFYNAWKHTLRKVFIKDVKNPEKGEGVIYKKAEPKEKKTSEDPAEPELADQDPEGDS